MAQKGIGQLDLVLVVLVAMLHAAVFAAIVPPWQAPDEPKHYEHVALVNALGRPVSRELADPAMQAEIIRSMGRFDFWRWGFGFVPAMDHPERLPFEWMWPSGPTQLDRPPLFYLLTSPIFGLLDGPPADRLLGLRVWSLLISSLTVGVVYLSARSIFPDRPTLVLGAAGLAALLPMYAFIGGSLNSDHPANLLTALLIFTLIRGYRGSRPVRTGALALVLMVAGFYTKRTTLFAVPLALLALAEQAVRVPIRRLRLLAFGGGIAAGLLAVAILTLPGVQRTATYLLDRYVFDVSLAENVELLASRQLTVEVLAVLLFHFLWGILQSFWARFGWMNLWVDGWLYQAVLAVNLLAFLGLVLFAVRTVRRPTALDAGQRAAIGLLALLLLGALAVPIVQHIAFMTPSYTPQGRYLFPAMVPIGILFMLGLQTLVPSIARGLLTFAFLAALFIFDAACVLLYLVPTYYG